MKSWKDMTEIERLQYKLRQRVKLRDGAMERRRKHLKKAEDELNFAFKKDEEVVRLLCEIEYRKERE